MEIESDTLREVFRLVGGRLRKEYWAWYRSLRWSSHQIQDWMEQSCVDGLMAASANLDKWDSEKGDFFLWCYLKARTFARDRLRKAEKENVFLDSLAAAPTEASYNPIGEYQADESMMVAFSQLSLDQQEALALYHLADIDVASIARILDCEVKTVYTIMDRGRKKARKIYEELRRSAGSVNHDERPPPRKVPPPARLRHERRTI